MRGLAGAPTSSGVRTNSDTSMAASEGVIVGSGVAGVLVPDCARTGDGTNPSRRITASVTPSVRTAAPARAAHLVAHGVRSLIFTPPEDLRPLMPYRRDILTFPTGGQSIGPRSNWEP